MPLSWDISEVNDHDELLEGREKAVTETLIFFSMVIESGGITEQNAPDWCAVLGLYQALYGPLLTEKHDDGLIDHSDITAADVWRRVGMRTNAGSLDGVSQIRKHGKRLAGDFMARIRHEQEIG